MALLADIASHLEDYYRANAGDLNDPVNDAAEAMAGLLVDIARFIDADYPLPTQEQFEEESD